MGKPQTPPSSSSSPSPHILLPWRSFHLSTNHQSKPLHTNIYEKKNQDLVTSQENPKKKNVTKLQNLGHNIIWLTNKIIRLYHKGIFLSKNLSGSLTKTLKIQNYMIQFQKTKRKHKTLSRERKKKEQEKDLSCHKG